MTKIDCKIQLKKHFKKLFFSSVITGLLVFFLIITSYTNNGGVSIDISGLTGENGNVQALEIMLFLTLFALAPSILIMTTSFTRIVIVLSLLRNAIGLQQTPPNQIIIGISLFLSLFIMNPVFSQINTEAYQPYSRGEITQQVALEKGIVPIKKFMLMQTTNSDLALFLKISNKVMPENPEEVPLEVLIPSFITSELKKAFTIGFLIFLPFLVIDIVVSTTLMSMGMIMLPPATIALPFKLMLFVLVDGWGLLIETLVAGFNWFT
ncbi:MAG: flagellar type III secretion system pore protein FliP [Oscillospiraceae bacterium]